MQRLLNLFSTRDVQTNFLHTKAKAPLIIRILKAVIKQENQGVLYAQFPKRSKPISYIELNKKEIEALRFAPKAPTIKVIDSCLHLQSVMKKMDKEI